MSKAQETLQVMVVDDNPVVRSGLVSLLEATGEVTVAAEAGDGGAAIAMANEQALDLILLDVRMPEVDGVHAVSELSQRCPVVMLTYTEDPEVVRTAIRNGASGYLVHGHFTADELAAHVRSAVTGSSPLSPPAAQSLFSAVRDAPESAGAEPERSNHARGLLSEREAELMDLIARGQSNGEVAAALFLSEKTVKNHVNRIYTKLGVTSRGAAIAQWVGTADGA